MKLAWDQTGERTYETGVKKGVLYPQADGGLYPKGVAWNGLSAVTESPSGAEPNPIYADDIKYLNLLSAEEFAATIEAYTYPNEFEECDGSAEIAPGVTVGQQKRKNFGLSYRTIFGNDTENDSYGYKLHLIYGCLAAPSEKGYQTVSDSPEAITFSWEVSTTPVSVAGFEPTASLTIDSTKVDAGKLAALEAILYGKDNELTKTQPEDWNTGYKNYFTKGSSGEFVAVTGDSAPSWESNKYYTAGAEARLPLPDEVAEIMAAD